VLSIRDAGARERAAAAALAGLSRTLQRDVNLASREKITPDVIAAARQLAPNGTSRAVAATGTYAATRGTPGVKFGGSRAVTRSGVPGRVLARPLEYGATGAKRTTFQAHSPRGRLYTVRDKRTTRQFAPRRDGGKFVAPAALREAPKAVVTWTEIVEEAIIAALDTGA
jgi:hypothetical protein